MNEQLDPQSPLDISGDLCSEMLFYSPEVTQQEWGRAGSAWAHGFMLLYPVDGTGFHYQFLHTYCVPSLDAWPWPCGNHPHIVRPSNPHHTSLAPGPPTLKDALDGQRCYQSSWLVYLPIPSLSLHSDPPPPYPSGI